MRMNCQEVGGEAEGGGFWSEVCVPHHQSSTGNRCSTNIKKDKAWKTFLIEATCITTEDFLFISWAASYCRGDQMLSPLTPATSLPPPLISTCWSLACKLSHDLKPLC